MVASGLLAHLCGAPRGQKDWAKFAQGLSQAQRGALGVRRQADGKYPAPSQPTFCRLMKRIDADQLEKIFLQTQEQIRGPAPPDELIVLDGKEPRHGGPDQIASGFLHRRGRQKKPQHKTTTDFFSAMNAEHHRYAIRCLQARQPSFQTAS